MAEEKGEKVEKLKVDHHVEWQFKLSIIFGAIVSLWAVYYNLLTPKLAGILIVGSMVGGILPGIDMGNSAALKMLEFGAVTLFSYFLFSKTWEKVDYFAFAAIMLGGLIFIIAFFLVLDLFLQPYGSFHSIPAAFASGLVIADILYYLFGVEMEMAYWSGIAVFIGYLVHLFTDAVMGIGKGGRPSSLTTLKLWGSSIVSSLFVYFIIGGAFLLLPHSKEIASGIFHNFISLF